MASDTMQHSVNLHPNPDQASTLHHQSLHSAQKNLQQTDEDVPGAFPTPSMLKRKQEEQATAPPSPSTVDEVKNAVQTLSNFARKYLPVYGTAYIRSKSKRDTGGHGLDERENETSAEREREQALKPIVGGLTEPVEIDINHPPSDGFPSGGVGSLPGTPNEVDIVRLPEDRQHFVEIASIDSHAPQSSLPSQELQPNSQSTNPFRNGKYKQATVQPPSPSQPEKGIDSPSEYRTEPAPQQSFVSQSEVPNPQGSQELHATSLQHRGPGKASDEPSFQTLGDGEETEKFFLRGLVTPSALSYNYNSSPKMTPKDPKSPSLSECVSQPSTSRRHVFSKPVSPAPLCEPQSEPLLTCQPHVEGAESPHLNMPGDGIPALPSEPNLRTFESHEIISQCEEPGGKTITSTGIGATSIPTPTQPVEAGLNRGNERKSVMENAKPGPEVIKEVKGSGQKSKWFPWFGRLFGHKASNGRGEISRQQPSLGNIFVEPSQSENEEKQNSPTSKEGPSVIASSPSKEKYPQHRTSLHPADETSTTSTPTVNSRSSSPDHHVEKTATMQSERRRLSSSPHEKPPTDFVDIGPSFSSYTSGESSVGKGHQQHGHTRPHCHSITVPDHNPAHLDATARSLPSHVEIREKQELPWTETPGGSRVGVGSLPGQQAEIGVAKLPVECLIVPSTTPELASHSYSPATSQALLPGESRAIDESSVISSRTELRPPLVTLELRSPTGREGSPEQVQSPAPDVLHHAYHFSPFAYPPGTRSSNIKTSYIQTAHAPSLQNEPQNSSGVEKPSSQSQLPPEGGQQAVYSPSAIATSTEPSRPKYVDQQVQTDVVPTQGPGDLNLYSGPSGARAFPGIENSGLFSLKSANHEALERLREIETGQRKTIFTAGQRQPQFVIQAPLDQSQHLPSTSLVRSFPRQHITVAAQSENVRHSFGSTSVSEIRTEPDDVEHGSEGSRRLDRVLSQRVSTTLDSSDVPSSQSTLQVPRTSTTFPGDSSRSASALPSVNVSTPQEWSSHPSRSSSADDDLTRALPSTHERISGKLSDTTPIVRSQYLRSIVNEPGTAVGTGGALPGYPTDARLSVLIGERIHDDYMRARGAVDPTQAAEDTMRDQSTPNPGPKARPQKVNGSSLTPSPITPCVPHTSSLEAGSGSLPAGASSTSPAPDARISDTFDESLYDDSCRYLPPKDLSVDDLGVPVGSHKQARRQQQF